MGSFGVLGIVYEKAGIDVVDEPALLFCGQAEIEWDQDRFQAHQCVDADDIGESTAGEYRYSAACVHTQGG